MILFPLLQTVHIGDACDLEYAISRVLLLQAYSSQWCMFWGCSGGIVGYSGGIVGVVGV